MQTYSLLLGVGTLTGLLLASWRAPEKHLSYYVNAGIWALFGTIIGSRAAIVLVNWGYYQVHLPEIFQVWMGGLSGIGALMGGIVSVLIVSKWKNIHTGALADALFPLAGTLMVTAWLGSWISGAAYGQESNAWWALPTNDEWGLDVHRVPVQFIGAIVTLLIIILLERSTKRFSAHGLNAIVGLFLLSGEIFSLSFLRADPAPMLYGLRADAWGAVGLMILSGLTWLVIWTIQRHRNSLSPWRKD
jgi:phosphatidylglycerol:prolipoprotein diacylglycerol transferase